MANDFLTEYDLIMINDLASGISDFYFPNGQVDPKVIAEKNGITYSYGKYGESFDGLIECENGKFHIYINEDKVGHQYEQRARFTFAHELGHYYIDSHRESLLSGRSPSHCSLTGFKSRNRAERQADYFASCLLMPDEKFTKHCFRKKFSYQIIQELAGKFGTSISATAIRFCAIGNHPIMVVYSKKNEIKWYWSSEDFPFKWLKYGKDKLPEDTVAGEYFSKNRDPKKTEPLYAMDWFSIRRQDQAETPFFEYALTRGVHCLSVIWET
ncbi:ImmA/IrrE family metallo-endopeptidase [uncultured Aquimarina sp.]|uniref:ImmA/IrrE family metallo-endopeptidase n=1 Tax=uncultured Aquimarina sp. TaxID=575652 RepID=UPI00260A8B8B|nr:ImmA/IrrE family metallo-endopeptidase [uncultured Aquimarina sp.]